jgi:hypothetical protein
MSSKAFYRTFYQYNEIESMPTTDYIQDKFNWQTCNSFFFSKPKGKWYSIKQSWNKNLRQSKNLIKPGQNKEDSDIKLNKYEDKFTCSKIFNYSIQLHKSKLTNLHSPNTNKILVLNTLTNILEFTNKYSCWDQASKDFGGIEIPIFFKSLNKENCPWYSAWNNPSGCIWNYEIIKEVSQL